MVAAAAVRAEAFVRAWRTRQWLSTAEYPAAPASVGELYETHLQIAQHDYVASEFGGLGGWKLGAIGAEGEPCIYAPLFKRFLVPEPGESLSAAAIQLFQIEPEVGVVLGQDLPARADGAPRSVEEVRLGGR